MFQLRAGVLFFVYLALVSSQPARGEPSAVKKPERADRHGDLLPDGAIARLGTVRFRSGSQVYAIAYSPDGRLLATSGYDRTICVWQTSSGRVVFRVVRRGPQDSSLTDIEFSPDGRILAEAGGSRESRIYLWDVSTAKKHSSLRIPVGESASHVTFSPSGETLAAICWAERERESRLRLWSLKTGEEVPGFQSPEANARSVAFAPDGKSLAVGLDGEICVCNAATGRKLRTLRRYNGHSAAIAFSPGGTIASATQDEEIVRLWDAATGGEKHVLRGHKGWIGSLFFSADGKRLVSSSNLSGVFLWDVASGKRIRILRRTGTIGSRGLALSPDGKRVAVASGQAVLTRFDVATGKEIADMPGHTVSVGFVAFTPDGRVVTSGFGGDVRVWEAATGKALAQVREEDDQITHVALSPDGRTVAGGLWNGTIRLWNLDTVKETGKLTGDAGPGPCLSFAPDGKTLAAGYCAITKGYVGTIILWNVASGKPVHQSRLPRPSGLSSIAFSPDGKTLASLGNGIRLWEAASGKELCELRMEAPKTSPHGIICFSPDGSLLAAPCYPKGFAVWDVASRSFLGRFDGNGQASRSVAFSPDGHLLACGKDDGAVELWEVLTWTPASRRQGPVGRVYAVGFSPDGRLLGSGHEDTTALLWDVPGLWTPAHSPTTPLTQAQLDALWRQLGSGQSGEALPAVAALSQAPGEILPLLRKKIRPARTEDAAAVPGLIADLDSDAFAVREKASRELARCGPAVVPALRAALAGQPSAEAKRRMEALLQKLDRGQPHERMTAEERRSLRAVALLERIGSTEARQVLREWSQGAPQSRLTQEAKASLRRLALRHGPP